MDIDLSKFFDRVHHDRLMHRLAARIRDKRVLKLIRAYLNSGTLIGEAVVETGEGTPQGGPLSPLLSNIVLDELVKELNEFLRGWAAYFGPGLSATLAKELDHWIRRRLRAYVWKQWKGARTRVRNLKARGVHHKWAMMVGNTRKGEWRLSKNGTLCAALPDDYFTRSLGLVLLGSSV